MITSVSLRNFKCFENQRIEFRPLTLLTGLNSAGKSTVIQALLLLKQSHLQGLIATGLALNGDFLQLGRGTDALYQDAEEDYIEIAVQTARGASRWRYVYDRDSDVIALADMELEKRWENCSLFTDRCRYLHAERLGPRTASEMSDFAVRSHKQLGIHGEFAAHFLSVFGREEITFDSLLHPKASSRKLRDQAEAWIGEVGPGTRIRCDASTAMDLVSLAYAAVARGEDVTNYNRATNVGFGISYALPVVLGLLSSGPDHLFLVENPEAHVHPRAQSELARLMCLSVQSGTQLVVESHSDHVLNGIRLAVRRGVLAPAQVSILYFARRFENGKLSVEIINPQIDSEGRLDKWPDGFFDEWDNTLEGLLDDNVRR